MNVGWYMLFKDGNERTIVRKDDAVFKTEGLTVMSGYVAMVATQPPIAPDTPSTIASDGIFEVDE